MDLNRFKEVNDTLGHAVGDELLVAVAQRLKLIFRDSDTIARLGGDEFVMLVEGLHNPSAMTEIANKINERISAPYLLHGETVNVSASLGTAIFPNDGEDSEALMEYADVNMYRAKQESKKQLALIRKS
jgi:diguanylate cyclase (GGDEF)-like protein